MQVISSFKNVFHLKKGPNVRERYRNLSEEEKNRNGEYGLERYKNLSKDEKQKLAEYRKKYYAKK